MKVALLQLEQAILVKIVLLLEDFSIKFSFPVFADASSGLRFRSKSISNLILNYDALLRCKSFTTFFIQNLFYISEDR